MIWTRRYHEDEWTVNMQGEGPDEVDVDYWEWACEINGVDGRWRTFRFMDTGGSTPSQTLPANWVG